MELVIEGVVNYLTGMSASSPKLVAIFAIAYVVGIALKVLRIAAESFIMESPSKEDDLALEGFKTSAVGKVVYFLADLLIRFKKPGA